MILRVVLRQPKPLRNWRDVTGATSALTRVECLRTLDRLRLAGRASDSELAAAREAVLDALSLLETIEITPAVLARAAEPFPVQIRTLDAIHLAAALLWREASEETITVATHDATLSLAARASGFDVVG